MQPQRAVIATLAALTLAPLSRALPAQEPERAPGPEPWELRLERGPDRLLHVVMSRRARLGIKVNLRAGETDSIGAYVDAVTPGGPADKADIRSGDIITKFDGQSVLTGGPAARDEQRSLPGLRLIELAARLEPGDTVAVELRREKQRKTVAVVTEAEPDLVLEGVGPGERAFVMRAPRPGLPLPVGEFTERIEAAPLELLGSPLADLELAPLNPDLGQYFGATEGVLVISAPKDSALGLRGGDVVVAIDGRKPASPYHLMRILRSYERGEEFRLEILRNRKRMTVTGRLDPRR